MRTRVFISYSHKDRAWLERLKVFLRPLERQGLIDRWDDTRLVAGDDWRREIRNAMSTARVVILLVSADFLASDFIDKEELPPLLEQAEAQGARIIPVVVSTCLLDGPNAPLARFQAINAPSNPLDGLTRAERNRIWTRLTEQVMAEFARSPIPAEPAPCAVSVDPVVAERRALFIVNDREQSPRHECDGSGNPECDALVNLLRSPEMGSFRVTVQGNNPSASRIHQEIRNFLRSLKPSDLGLLYYFDTGSGSADGEDRGDVADDVEAERTTTIDVLQLAMRRSAAGWQVVLLDCPALVPATASGVVDPGAHSRLIAGFQGEGRFVLSSERATNGCSDFSWARRVDDSGPTTLAGLVVHGLQTGKADRDGDKKVSIADLFDYLEEAVAARFERQGIRWAFDQGRSEAMLADVALQGEREQPTPVRVRDRVTQDIRQPIFEVTVPTYILDPYFFILDWNPAFDELIAKEVKLVRGQDHARAFVQALANCEEAFTHGQEAFGPDRYPLVDTEVLVFDSAKYGRLRFKKFAAQITNDDGGIRGWSVSLNILDDEGSERMWQDLKSRVEEEVGWSRYASVYDRLLLHFNEYTRLVRQVTDLVGDARLCIDLGAGTGNGALRLLRAPDREVWAVEVNETMLRHFRAKLEDPENAALRDRLTVVKDDIQRLDALPRATFDAAVMINVLYAVRDREACLREVNRILKPRGTLALSTSHRGTDVDRLFRELRRSLEAKGIFFEFQEHFDAARARHEAMMAQITRDTVEDTLGMLKDAGFEIVRAMRDQYVGAVTVIQARKSREHRARTVTVAAPQSVRAGDVRDGDQAEIRDVFVSYANEDRGIAEAIRQHLEWQGFKCWIAARDIKGGSNFPAAIINAIDSSRVLILVLSNAANESQYAASEVARAFDQKIPIVPYRAEEVLPAPGLALYLSRVHWFDAYPGPTEDAHLERLGARIRELISSLAGDAAEAEET